ncbi:unnamed protein product [Psylliodes chrysocephalus]|uniref:Peptidase S1 domain-containing protein n=1 Tax=Psylliodes chrysocephalus TaxID=3402493 RepID=A0A9P0CU50_9CUCU|nr:unnamed protein product [Psylliodes chrysocephala]
MKTLIFCIFFIKIVLINANVPQLDGRIIGGKNANITECPYQVSLRKYDSHICGGTIFHNKYILTAAHCASNGVASSFSIRAGSSYSIKGGTIVKVCSIYNHENYSAETMENDIAILKLCTPLTFSNYILPITLADGSESIAAGRNALVSGWGFKIEEGAVSNILQKVTVPFITNARCKVLYPDEIITDGMLCAGLGQKDACQGDSGGPLRASGKLVGIVSWGYGCARPQFPGVYTKVAKYRKWIKRYTNY